ncbi:type IV toxin-antitoxin system AbiEi family antitoxin domain-containing protein [Pseudarthrobacter sp. NPDC058362]|uniref:type IV toxin-antitoxin system AbiEi family antitoxin domain-containing protein n=1 Tax=Pseudarthrobacter sp. NPDC058362 TaxID=3346458 RepID=UPI0036675F9A
MQTITETLAAVGGVASSASLRLAGVPRRSIEACVLDGSVQRIARGVYALPDADPLLIHAGRHHAVPGCVTAAGSGALGSPAAPEAASCRPAWETGPGLRCSSVQHPPHAAGHCVPIPPLPPAA